VTPAQLAAMAQSRGCGWLSFTYNDPSIFPEYARACAEAARAVGVRSCWVTNGYATEEQLDYLGDLVVAMNIDLKGSDAFYRKLCGARLAPVQATIASAVRRGIWVEVTTLVVPGENDSDADLTAIADFLASVSADIPWHLSAFHPDYHMQDRGRTPPATLKRAVTIGRKAGLRYIYTGNVHDDANRDTVCAECHATVIERSGYSGVSTLGPDGKCHDCGAALPGVWS
jgi:pyruvate formate lyase activating enzyme